ncbi:hypothetical protein ACWKWP_01145 [Agromyces soli]
MHRLIKTTAVVFAGALLLSGCAAGGDSAGGDSASSACETARVAVRGISNGAQNTLATATDAAETVDYLDGLETRVSDVAATVDNEKLTTALGTLSSAIDDAKDYAATLKADVEPDPEALAAAQTKIQEAATAFNTVCAGE